MTDLEQNRYNKVAKRTIQLTLSSFPPMATVVTSIGATPVACLRINRRDSIISASSVLPRSDEEKHYDREIISVDSMSKHALGTQTRKSFAYP